MLARLLGLGGFRDRHPTQQDERDQVDERMRHQEAALDILAAEAEVVRRNRGTESRRRDPSAGS
jgi:hypothetical protein